MTCGTSEDVVLNKKPSWSEFTILHYVPQVVQLITLSHELNEAHFNQSKLPPSRQRK
jgi:hypothetical protein